MYYSRGDRTMLVRKRKKSLESRHTFTYRDESIFQEIYLENCFSAEQF